MGRWKLPVAVGVNVVAGITAVTQAATADEASSSASEALAWISLLAYFALALVLVGSFWWMLLEPAAQAKLDAALAAMKRKQESVSERRDSDSSFANPMVAGQLGGSAHDVSLGTQSVEARAEALRVLRGKPGSIGEGMRVGDVSASLHRMRELEHASESDLSIQTMEHQTAVQARREYTKLAPVRARIR